MKWKKVKIGSFSRNLQTHLYSQVCTFLFFVLSWRYFAIHCWMSMLETKSLNLSMRAKHSSREKKIIAEGKVSVSRTLGTWMPLRASWYHWQTGSWRFSCSFSSCSCTRLSSLFLVRDYCPLSSCASSVSWLCLKALGIFLPLAGPLGRKLCKTEEVRNVVKEEVGRHICHETFSP